MNNPRRTLASWAVALVVASLGVVQLTIETSTDSVLDRDSPEWGFYQASQARFGGDEVMTIVVEADAPYSVEALGRIERLTQDLAVVPGVRRVDSLATVPLVYATPDGDLSLDPALKFRDYRNPTALAELVTLVRADRIARRALVSDDGRSFAVHLVLEQGADQKYDELFARLDVSLRNEVVWISGVPVFRREATRRTTRELAVFVPLTIITLSVLLWALFRSLAAIAIPIVSSSAGTWVLLGAMGALGVPLTITTVILPSIMLALGCAYCMHVLTASRGRLTRPSLEAGLLPVALPVALSSLTTAIGFVAVSLVRIEAIRDVGAFGALGVVVVGLATLTAAPAMLALWPVRSDRSVLDRWIEGDLSRRLADVAKSRRGLLLAGWLLALVAVAPGASLLHVETDVIVWFAEGHRLRVDYREIRDRLAGISPVNVVVEAERELDVASPELVASLDGLSRFLESLDDVGKVVSLADPLRQLHGGFLGDESMPLPDEVDQIEQYLMLLESEPYIHDLVTDDRKATNVVIRSNNNGSGPLRDVARAAEEWWATNGPAGYSARATGIMYEFARSEDEIAFGQLRGLSFALVAIALVLLSTLGSLSLAAVALVPNVVPLVAAFSVMGLVGIPLDAGTVLLGNLALGIAVDDTIHLVTAYHARRSAGESGVSSLEGGLRLVLSALVYTTVVVAAGFGVLAFSGFSFTRNLGLLTSGILVACLLADLLLLPALMLTKRGRTAALRRQLEGGP